MQRPRCLTFANFVPVPENRSALLAVQHLLQGLDAAATAPSLLFLHGPTGVGKSHLASALAEAAVAAGPKRSVSFAAATEAATLTVDESCDLQIIEDLRHWPRRLAGILTARLDFLQTHRVPTLCTALVGPRQLNLPERTLSRLAAGLVVGLEPLTCASRLALLQTKARSRRFTAAPDVLAWLAQHLRGGRQLDGALTQLEILARGQHKPLNLTAVQDQFSILRETARLTVECIAEKVGSHFQVDVRQLRSGQRMRRVLIPRQIGIYLTRQLTALSLDQIGAYFGGRDHSTVLNACRKVEQAISTDAVLSGTIHDLYQNLT